MTPEVSDYAREVTDFVVSVPRRVHALQTAEIYTRDTPGVRAEVSDYVLSPPC